MGNIKKYKPKQDNIVKLELYLKKVENGREKDKRVNSKGK
jgi:hypothetical protein